MPSPAYRDCWPLSQTGVLLVNSGTPDSLDTRGVRRFLRRLLRDRRTIEVPRAIWCWILYFIILPTRPARVLPKYRRVWTRKRFAAAACTPWRCAMHCARSCASAPAHERSRGTGHAVFHAGCGAGPARTCARPAHSASWCCRCSRSIPAPPMPPRMDQVGTALRAVALRAGTAPAARLCAGRGLYRRTGRQRARALARSMAPAITC